MSVTVLGINHNSASISLREKIAFSPEEAVVAIKSLAEHPSITSCLVLSTCNRTELYLNLLDAENECIERDIMAWLADFHQIDLTQIHPHFYCYSHDNAITHLMRVACGLDSRILGESQILGQLKKSYAISKAAGVISGVLDRAVQKAFAVAKRVRTETQINSYAISVGYMAYLTLSRHTNNRQDLVVMIIGAGETIKMFAHYLKKHPVKHIIIANRSSENAIAVAHMLDAEIITLPDIQHRLHEVDVVVSATNSVTPLVTKTMVECALLQREYQKMVFIDMAAPRDIDNNVTGLRGCHVYSIDDLQSEVDQNGIQRQQAAEQAQHFIIEEVNRFSIWLKERNATQTIKEYRAFAEQTKNELMTMALHDLKLGVDAHVVVTSLAQKLTNKLLHSPTQFLRQIASETQQDRSKISDKLK